MTYKHTPGPLQYAFEGGTVAVILESDGTTVAKLSVTENTPAHSALAANARLFSAAPDLLEALQSIEEYWNQDPNEMAMADACWHAINTARAAIARATGEQP